LKDRLVITISDVNGTKSYNIAQTAKKYLCIVVAVVVLLLGISFLLINYLSTKVETLKKEEQRLSSQNKLYSMQITDKVKDIEELSSKLDNIAEMIGLNQDEKETNLIKKATLATITTAKKQYMLQTIPSGHPMKIPMKVTAKFGYRIHPILKRKKFHKGVDLRAPRRTPVYATADGVVKFVEHKNVGTFGRIVHIVHNYGFETVYGHLRFTKVKAGDIVKKGQLIAMSGNSGRSTGPHLHYEVRHANKILNPMPFLDWDIKHYEDIFKRQRRVKWDSLINLIATQNKLLEQQ
jgi:murein DD-endopeptidase MepM/ murein hydrolase activator NlpD